MNQRKIPSINNYAKTHKIILMDVAQFREFCIYVERKYRRRGILLPENMQDGGSCFTIWVDHLVITKRFKASDLKEVIILDRTRTL